MAGRGAVRNGRGGYQQPSNPAPVSGPGRLSQRTDGQPVRPTPANRPGGQHGDRQASVQQQQAAPLRAGGVAAPSSGGMVDPGMAEALPANADEAVWGASKRPWEPVTAGARLGPGAGAPADDSAADLLRALMERWPDDNLGALLEQLGNG